jgi:hypothetical protein
LRRCRPLPQSQGLAEQLQFLVVAAGHARRLGLAHQPLEDQQVEGVGTGRERVALAVLGAQVTVAPDRLEQLGPDRVDRLVQLRLVDAGLAPAGLDQGFLGDRLGRVEHQRDEHPPGVAVRDGRSLALTLDGQLPQHAVDHHPPS